MGRILHAAAYVGHHRRPPSPHLLGPLRRTRLTSRTARRRSWSRRSSAGVIGCSGPWAATSGMTWYSTSAPSSCACSARPAGSATARSCSARAARTASMLCRSASPGCSRRRACGWPRPPMAQTKGIRWAADHELPT